MLNIKDRENEKFALQYQKKSMNLMGMGKNDDLVPQSIIFPLGVEILFFPT